MRNNNIKEKLEEILLEDDIVTSINNNLDFLLNIIPELRFMIGFQHKHPHHHLDVWNHTLLALSLSKKDYDIRLSLLLHDIGKPFSFQEGEIRHFYNHPLVSYKMSTIILERLDYNQDFINRISYLILNHDHPISSKQIKENYELCLKLYEVQRCDALAHHPERLEKREEYLNNIKNKLILVKNIDLNNYK